VLPGKLGFVRQPVGADKHVCLGSQGPLTKSRIFASVVTSWRSQSID
jgi:hypothetical protein